MTVAKLINKTWFNWRSPILFVIILLCLFLLYILDIKSNFDSKRIKLLPAVKLDRHEGFVIKTTGCRIPSLDPFDASVLQFIYKINPFDCGHLPQLVSSNLTSLFINQGALFYYNIDDWKKIECCYRPFWRVNSKSGAEDTTVQYGNCQQFIYSVKVEEEFVKVSCRINNTIIFSDFYSFVPEKRKIDVFERSDASFKTGTDKLNVLIVGLDSISRLNFKRQMPLTDSFLLNKLNAIELVGYNKVEDNTFPNLVPFLSGYSEEELVKSCWPTLESKFDDCPFLWKNFSEAGYLTCFAEDASWMGMFNYMKTGFNKQPTDYHWRTFNYVAEKELGHNRFMNAELCIGLRPTFTVLLEYMWKFVTSVGNKPYFAFFWESSLTHDLLNSPSLGDKNYEKFFSKMKNSNLLNQTVLIVMSDHGMRWGQIRMTHQGQLEERLPFLFFVLPKWFQKKYSNAVASLRRNTRRLTTPYDLHETIKDLLSLEQILPNQLKIRTQQNETTKRGISLFLNIPEERTCSMAGILPHWCTCQKSVAVQTNDSIVVRAAHYIVNKINSYLVGYKTCAALKLNKIQDARIMKTDDYIYNNSTINDYILIVKTIPGGGVFEATVRCLLCNTTNPFSLTGTISRINLYGNQSHCITNFHMKLYCYCGG